jgi:thiol:disulfide interchange protein DsbC
MQWEEQSTPKDNMKLFNKQIISGLAMSLMTMTTYAQSDPAEIIKKSIGAKLGNGARIESVKKAAYPGLYEVQVDSDIFYTDEKMHYLFVGNIIDLNTHKNLTKARLESLNTIQFSDLPLELAFKQVKGDGKRVIAVFEDPNCGYCKRLRKALQSVNNITIYTFMYDILSDDSVVKSRNVWCSADPVKTWNDWMVLGKQPSDAPSTCMTNPHEKIMALGKKLHINGTPAIFFTDGSRIPGYVDAAALEEKLNSIK